MTTTGILDYFTALVAEDESLPLTEAALSLAQDAYPDLDMQGVLAEIDELVVRVRRRMPDDADIKQKVGVLNRFFFPRHSASRAITTTTTTRTTAT